MDRVRKGAAYIVLLLACLGSVKAQEPVFSMPHGLYAGDISLWMTTSDPEALIFYTTDGSDPRLHGQRYEGGLHIDRTTVVRAASQMMDETWTDVTSATYILPESLRYQTGTPQGYPTTWGSYCQISGTAKADYEMDPDMTDDPVLWQKIKAGLGTLPIISLVTDRDNLFGHERDEEKGGIYVFTGCPVGDDIGRGWERPVSFELIGGPTQEDLTVDCCLKLHGGHGRLPEKNPKHAFRLHFKKDYGPGKLKYPVFGEDGPKSFNALVLRTFFGYSWQHWDNSQRSKAQYSRDLWARCMQARMGHPISRGRYAHLFINGMYWGIYNLCERVTDDFCKQNLGGKAEDWDVVEVDGGAGNYHAAFADYGDVEAWNQMCDYIYTLPDHHENYLHLIGLDSNGQPSEEFPPLLDVDNYIDYMLINLYGGNTDWDHHNWFAYRNRATADHGFRFLCWDTENIFVSTTEDLTSKNNRGCPTGFMNRLMKDRLFAHRFHQIAQQRLFCGGLLTPRSVVQTWDSLYGEIATALYDEAARWGDYRRDVHPYSTRGELYTVDSQFQKERNRLLNSYFPTRTDIFIEQLRTRGWFPRAEAPQFYIGEAAIGYNTTRLRKEERLSIHGDELYYTLDGTDPVTWAKTASGELTPSATPCQSGTDILAGMDRLLLPDTLEVKAISRSQGEWSPIVTARLAIQKPVVDYAIYAADTVAFTGHDIAVPICLKNLSPVAQWQLDITLPDGISFETDTKGKPVVELNEERTYRGSFNISTYSFADGSVRLLCKSLRGKTLNGNDGEVARLHLRVAADAPASSCQVQLSNISIADADGTLFSLRNAAFCLTVRNLLPGDIDCNGQTDRADLLALTNIILGLPCQGVTLLQAADVNGDGRVDGADIVCLASIIMRAKEKDKDNYNTVACDKRQKILSYIKKQVNRYQNE